MVSSSFSAVVGQTFFALCKSVDSPVSLGAWLRFTHNQRALAEMEIHPKDYLDCQSFEADYLVSKYLSSYKGLETGIDLNEAAMKKFATSEDQCKMTNDRLRSARTSGFYPPDVAAVLHYARFKIAWLLGDLPSPEVDPGFGWGPGATLCVKRRESFPDTKLRKLPITSTRRNLPLFREELQRDLHWSSVILNVQPSDILGEFCFTADVFEVTEACRIKLVPKNAKTNRVIAVEPRANGFVQKHYGSYIRKRLLSVGIDLSDQTRNQRASQHAIRDRTCTIDLSMASDTVATELVYELLPVEWAFALDAARSHEATLPDGSTITFQKFSSMGNGFTFELETLIFWALTSACCYHQDSMGDVLVYGDDIICPSESFELVHEVLRYAGFTLNTSKTFSGGQFYESCGKHYFAGFDVTPIYQKEVINDERALVRMGNRIIRCASRLGGYSRLYRPLYSPWMVARRASRSSNRLQIPLGSEGDDGWVTPAEYFAPVSQDLNLGLRARVYTSIRKRLPACPNSLLALSLRTGKSTDSPDSSGSCSGDEDHRSDNIVLTEDSTWEGSRWVMPTGEFGLSFDD